MSNWNQSQARSWSFRRGARFETESEMWAELCHEEEGKIGAKNKCFSTRFISRLEVKKALF